MTVAVLVTSIAASEAVVITVWSSKVFPSVSSPSSDVSETLLVFPGLLRVTKTLFWILPVLADNCVIV